MLRGDPKNRLAAIRDLTSRCDLCVVDLDQCIYPGFTQITLGASLVLRSLEAGRRRLFPQLMGGAAYIAVAKAAGLAGREATNVELMGAYSRVIRGVPDQLVEEGARRLPRTGPQAWRPALAEIAAQMSVYLVTFTIEPIARAYENATDDRGSKIFQGSRSTPLDIEDGLVQGCRFTADTLSPEAKVEAMEELLSQDGKGRPLVIGHGRDEAGLAERARGLGGGSIGIRPASDHAPSFDIVLPNSRAWSTITKALERC